MTAPISTIRWIRLSDQKPHDFQACLVCVAGSLLVKIGTWDAEEGAFFATFGISGGQRLRLRSDIDLWAACDSVKVEQG